MHPLRTPSSTTIWQQLQPAAHLLHGTLRRKNVKSRALVLHPGAGGRCKKRLIVYEPATEPIRFRMGLGPSLDSTGLSYYRRPEHLRTNRTKNRRPGHSKTLVCNIVMVTYYRDHMYDQLCKLPPGRRADTPPTSYGVTAAVIQQSTGLSNSVLDL